jgi:hypothetical protein
MSEMLNNDQLIQESTEVILRQFTPSKEGLGPLLVEIEKRCTAANLESEPSHIDETADRLVVRLPAGRDKKELIIRDTPSAEGLLGISFEKITGISGYKAYCSYEFGYIEALIDPGRHVGFPNSYTYRRLLSSLHKRRPEEEDITVRQQLDHEDEQFPGIVLTIGPATQEYGILETLRIARTLYTERFSRLLTIRIEGLSITRHDQVMGLLERIANSALFQIDLLTGMPLFLALDEEREIRPRRLFGSKEEISLTFPKYQYDSKPMSLYWYASIATGMPLLQYLAYYQVIEYFFPVFADKATYDIVKRMFKDPAYHRNPDAHIGQLISALKPFLSKGGYGDEQSALLETIRNCVTESELRGFFNENRDRFEFFKSKSQVITSEKISVDREKAEIISETANRLYEIRCKIVHTKSTEVGGQKGLILPFSSEAQRLGFDIELVQFLARKVLVATATPLTI